MENTLDKPLFFDVLSDPALQELWFPGDPRAADGTIIDARLLTDERVEVWHEIRDGKRIEVRLVPMDRMRYPLSIDLDGVCEIDAREFTEGRRYDGLTPVTVPLEVDGPRPEFTFGAGAMPVVSRRLAELIESICPTEVQRFPITALPSITGYEILNVTAIADCLDETISTFKKFTPESARPDRVGDYSEVGRLRIDPRRTNNHDIFRIRGWEVALIVSDRVKAAMEGIENLGVIFDPVTDCPDIEA